jgi:uncharacterized protein YndB with AHSA1/START domain
MNEPAASRSLIIEREMPHPAEKIWRALTQGGLIEEWLMKNDFQPVVGHRFSFRSTPVPGWDGVINSEVLTIEPNSKLAYSWGTMGMTPTATGTHLRMEQTGFRSETDAAYKGATYGWTKFIGNMERVVAGLD